MKEYYYNCPRGFANEFSIISVDKTNKKEVEKMREYLDRYMHSNNINWYLDKITYKRAMWLIRAERSLKRSYERAGLNLCCNPVGATEITTATEFFEEW